MAKEQTVTIPVEEYKALLLKREPDNAEKAILGAVFNAILDNAELTDSNSYYSTFKGIRIKDTSDCLKAILQAIYYTDRNRFIEIYKAIASDNKNDEINKINMEYLRKIKELKGEND